MPHLKFKAIPENVVAELSLVLPELLAPLLGTTKDNFSFEYIQSKFYEQGAVTSFYPYVEFGWFDRGQHIQDECAKLITESIQLRSPSEYVVVVFQDLPKSAYYENSKNFSK